MSDTTQEAREEGFLSKMVSGAMVAFGKLLGLATCVIVVGLALMALGYGDFVQQALLWYNKPIGEVTTSQLFVLVFVAVVVGSS